MIQAGNEDEQAKLGPLRQAQARPSKTAFLQLAFRRNRQNAYAARQPNRPSPMSVVTTVENAITVGSRNHSRR